MASDLPLPLFVFLFLVLLPTPCSSWRPADDDDASVSRSVFPMDGDVAWVVQVSDLHISTYNPERAAELALLGTALRAIRPHLLLVTSDITGEPSALLFLDLKILTSDSATCIQTSHYGALSRAHGYLFIYLFEMPCP